jgi:two-component system, NtrC family, sensor kinase
VGTSGSILVVDDRVENRYAIAHTLAHSGFSAIEASTGKEALELAKGLPTVIILDVKLPDILGYEVCRRIKANPLTSHIPILQLSAAFLSNESRVYALDSGADAYLTQPVEPYVLIATVRALVRLREAESQAKVSALQWQATFDALDEGVALVDSAGTVQRCNRAMSSLLGRPYAQIEGQPISRLIQQCFGLTIDHQHMVPSQEVRSDVRHFRWNFNPVLLDEASTGSIFILSEITEQKRTEGALLISERLAATGRMANTIAHEINNPLEAITNLLYLLEGALDTPDVASKYLASAEQELSRVSGIARQILSFHRESASPVFVNLSELLENVVVLHRLALADKDLRIQKEWDTSLSVRGFPAQLRQVFSNLIRNAIEASYVGKCIRIRISKGAPRNGIHGQAARVTICDAGVGIQAENLRRIFEAFFTTKELKGSGVGLWLSSTIVHEHRGRIQVRSNTDPRRSGTCVSVVLPCDWQG